MANIRKGIITIPYPRTNELADSWRKQAKHTQDELVFEVSTTKPRSEYVQWKPHQHSRMRIIGHKTVQGVIKDSWPRESKKAERALASYQPRQP